MGGPYLPPSSVSLFDAKVEELDQALKQLDTVQSLAARLPLADPAGGRVITSTFGVRTDPLLGTPAMHSGMDFRSAPGEPARATGGGTVISAGWNGGYGRMVEIDHGHGITSRFAHLRRIKVAEGQIVKAGDVIGETGNSGRSTGPHLHYEIRRQGEAVDPLRFVKAGRKIAGLL